MGVRSLAIVCVWIAASMATAGPVPVSVRAWVTPKPGQTPFDPPPDGFAPDMAFDLSPGADVTLGSFGPSELWVAPDPVYDPNQSKAGFRQYLFTYNAEVTDGASGQSKVFTVDGAAEANWIQRYDGLVLPGMMAVTFAAPADGWTTVGANRYRLTVTEQGEGNWMGADVSLMTALPEVPEPGTLLLAGVGLVAAWAWRKKQRRAVLTSGHLPL